MKENYNPELNIFMMCGSLNHSAMTDLPDGYSLRYLRESELDIWKRMPFDGKETSEHLAYMDDFFYRAYAPKRDLFFRSCLFAVDRADEPVGTCFAWKTFDSFTTLHWFKVLPSYENKGIGRALLSAVMGRLTPDDYPVYLHTQLGSFRAIKLYSDFGFKILKDELVGHRHNDYEQCLPLLKRLIPSKDFEKLSFAYTDGSFSESAAACLTNDF